MWTCALAGDWDPAYGISCSTPTGHSTFRSAVFGAGVRSLPIYDYEGLLGEDSLITSGPYGWPFNALVEPLPCMLRNLPQRLAMDHPGGGPVRPFLSSSRPVPATCGPLPLASKTSPGLSDALRPRTGMSIGICGIDTR